MRPNVFTPLQTWRVQQWDMRGTTWKGQLMGAFVSGGGQRSDRTLASRAIPGAARRKTSRLGIACREKISRVAIDAGAWRRGEERLWEDDFRVGKCISFFLFPCGKCTSARDWRKRTTTGMERRQQRRRRDSTSFQGWRPSTNTQPVSHCHKD